MHADTERTCFLLLYTQLDPSPHLLLLHCWLSVHASRHPKFAARPSPADKSLAHSSEARTLLCRSDRPKTSGQRVDCCPGSPGAWHLPTATHESPHPLPPGLACPPRSSLHQIQGQARETALLHLPCCPARRRPSFLTTLTRNKTKSAPKRHVCNTQRIPTTPSSHSRDTETKHVSCLRPRHSRPRPPA